MAPIERSGGRRWGRRLLLVAVVAAVAVAGGYALYPRVRLALMTVSTDDAYVNSHVTHVAPRITENVREVHVDDNDFVRKGDLLVVLDDELWRVRVHQARAALQIAQKSREQALAKARAAVAAARANRFQLAAAMSNVRNQVAGLRGAVARLNEARVAERLAQAEAERYAELARRRSVSQEEADIRRTDYDQAKARVRQALEEVHRIRAGLDLPEEPEPGHDLTEVPPDLDQHHSSVLAALGTLALNLADLGVPLPSYYDTPDQFLDEIRKKAPDGDIDALIEQTVRKAPNVEAAEAQVEQAEEQLAEAELNLSYCEIRAEIDGFISNRNVNPGDRVVQGERLMAIRSFEEVWIDCNFKETQLEPIRIGHPVDITIDAYPGKVFRGRVSGFSPGTGAAMALLPPQNATGNFVKIVQRLPVRVDLVGANPPDTPLFIGLSAVPYVRIYDPPTGPYAGQRLRGSFPTVVRVIDNNK
ncbi:MAG: HlyD family secretion protein [Isosphaeraceae bacterium]|nr:HlyD family secretion protein [Isosphaeraceae bacterium]